MGAGAAGGTRGLCARCECLTPRWPAAMPALGRGKGLPGGVGGGGVWILLLLQILAKPQGPAPDQQNHSNAPAQEEGGKSCAALEEERGTRGAMPEGAGEPRGYPAPVGTLTFIPRLLGDEEGAKKLHRNRVSPWRSQVSKPRSKGSRIRARCAPCLARGGQRQHTCYPASAPLKSAPGRIPPLSQHPGSDDAQTLPGVPPGRLGQQPRESFDSSLFPNRCCLTWLTRRRHLRPQVRYDWQRIAF